MVKRVVSEKKNTPAKFRLQLAGVFEINEN